MLPALPARACEPSPRAPAGLRLGLVLSGGGAKAAYEAGLALALHERGVVPAAVAGTSSGALTFSRWLIAEIGTMSNEKMK